MMKQTKHTKPMRSRCSAAGLLLAALLVQSFAGRAQVTVQLMPVSPVQLKISDMWRAQLINTSGTEQNIYLRGSVNYTNSNLIVEGISEAMVLKPGVTLLSPASVIIKGYQFNPAVSVPNLSSTEMFPFGAYTLCLKVYNNASAELGANCVEATIKPLSPPMLLSPYHQSEVPVVMPLLIWSAPTPVPTGTFVQYELRLVELLEGQTATDAIQRNFALIEEKNLSTNFFQYPATAAKLQKNKHYAWQVTARGDNFLIGSTEVWTFTLLNDTIGLPVQMPGQFYEPKSEADGTYGVAVETLGVILKEGSDNLTIHVFDNQRQRLKVRLQPVRVDGSNKYILNLKEEGVFKNGNLYFIEIINGTNEKKVLLIKYYSSQKRFSAESEK